MDRKKIEEKNEELIHKNTSANEKLKRIKNKVKEMEKSYSELKDIHQRTKSYMEI